MYLFNFIATKLQLYFTKVHCVIKSLHVYASLRPEKNDQKNIYFIDE